jgi:peptide/nickel transport system ATP-binding protein
MSESEIRHVRWRRISMVFQAAMNSLNPVYKVGDQIVEALETHLPQLSAQENRKRVEDLFRLVGLDPKLADQYPHEYSGGMRQRAVIAMALACQPDLIIADEPTTALDVIVQDSLLREMTELQKQLGMAMIYISRHRHRRVSVPDRGDVRFVVEFGDLGHLQASIHPYTQGLLSAFPSIIGPKRELATLPGEPPDLISPPSGCRFHPRCPYATDVCTEKVPVYEEHRPGHFAACWHPLEHT